MGENMNSSEAVHGYSLIKLQERESLGNASVFKLEDRVRSQMNIYFKKLAFSFNFKLNYQIM